MLEYVYVHVAQPGPHSSFSNLGASSSRFLFSTFFLITVSLPVFFVSGKADSRGGELQLSSHLCRLYLLVSGRGELQYVSRGSLFFSFLSHLRSLFSEGFAAYSQVRLSPAYHFLHLCGGSDTRRSALLNATRSCPQVPGPRCAVSARIVPQKFLRIFSVFFPCFCHFLRFCEDPGDS